MAPLTAELYLLFIASYLQFQGDGLALVVEANQMCDELRHVLTALMSRETENYNTRVGISELRSRVIENEAEKLRKEQVRASGLCDDHK